ncbi:hypothetical protein FH608_035365 [Nonomuraea phyllanthi]|uniref:Uncharacterized protein n=1 Tax=Nonomuraea phyllanthi TaxID=2219224 RepID=A0A5C4VW26_9ACTN|nr:hypothetical protein FH608_035365 [Nonomuraea phyllanthi]QFY13907.1 hypothetical protein GBF35_01340 [Nonomuraea phyllanthi]
MGARGAPGGTTSASAGRPRPVAQGRRTGRRRRRDRRPPRRPVPPRLRPAERPPHGPAIRGAATAGKRPHRASETSRPA